MENIHPLFVHFPIALLSVFFLIDLWPEVCHENRIGGIRPAGFYIWGCFCRIGGGSRIVCRVYRRSMARMFMK